MEKRKITIDQQLAPEEIPIGTIVGGRYRVLSRCGQGGMGVVYKVEQIFVAKQMALKTICAKDLSEVSWRRFQTEARAAFAVKHPNVVSVHDFGTLEDGTPFMAMDFIEGKTLAEKIKAVPGLPIEQVLSIFIQVCFGLTAAHDRGIVHRDLKPSNIIIVDGASVGEEGSVKIVDFGIAKLIESDGGQIQELTRTGEIFGSPLYMSPEQCQGGRVDHRSDIYSLGCVLFEALAGVPPFGGENALSTMMQHLSQKAPTLKEVSLGRDFPPSLESLVAKMLAKDPADRYQNLGFVVHSLAQESKRDHSIVSISSGHDMPAKLPKKFALTENISSLRVGALLLATSVLFFCLGFYAHRLANQSQVGTSTVSEPPGSKEDADATEVSDLVKDAVDRISAPDTGAAPMKVQNALKTPTPDGLLTLALIVLDAQSLRAIAASSWLRDFRLVHGELDNKGLSALRNNHRLKAFHAVGSNFNDVGAECISQNTSIQSLGLDGTQITDAGLLHISRMKQLEKLEIAATRVSDAGIEAIAKMPNLKVLRLRALPGLTPRAISMLAKSPVQFLEIDGNPQFDDRIIDSLKAIPRLLVVDLSKTMVSPKGVERLLEGSHVGWLLLIDCPKFSTDPGADERLRKKFLHVKIDQYKEE